MENPLKRNFGVPSPLRKRERAPCDVCGRPAPYFVMRPNEQHVFELGGFYCEEHIPASVFTPVFTPQKSEE